KRLHDDRKEGGLALFRRLQVAFPDDFWANHYLGWALLHSARPTDAITYYTAAIALRPDSPGAYQNRGFTYAKLRNWDTARTAFEKAIALARGSAWAHGGLGTALIHLGDPGGALGHARRAVELAPNDGFYQKKLGYALLEVGDAAAALPALQRA